MRFVMFYDELNGDKPFLVNADEIESVRFNGEGMGEGSFDVTFKSGDVCRTLLTLTRECDECNAEETALAEFAEYVTDGQFEVNHKFQPKGE